jgi:hypothetical protein
LSLPNGNKSDSNHNTIKVHSFNDNSSYHPLPEGDLSYVYLHWNLDSFANGYVSEINKEYQLESMNCEDKYKFE